MTVMLKPLLPIASDCWSHAFNGFDHISLVHAKYGNQHLQKELAENSAGNESNKSQDTVKFEGQVSFHFGQQVIKYDFLFRTNDIQYSHFYPGKLLFVPLSSQGPPPNFPNKICKVLQLKSVKNLTVWLCIA